MRPLAGDRRLTRARVLALTAAATMMLVALGAPLAALEAGADVDDTTAPAGDALEDSVAPVSGEPSSPLPAPTPEPEEVVSEVLEAIEEATEAVEDTASEVAEEAGLADEEEPAPSPSPSPSPTPKPSPGGSDDADAPARDTGGTDRPPAVPQGRAVSLPPDAPAAAPLEVPAAPVSKMPPVGEYVDHLRGVMGGSPRVDLAPVRRFEASGPRSTAEVLRFLGAAPVDVVARIVAPFPVAGPASYSDDWAAPRHTPFFHLHEGTDIFAARGTPVVASTDGVVSRIGRDTAIGGNSLRLTAADGTFFYYAHLDGFAQGLGTATEVRVGQVIGFVGDSGNAAGTPPHLHYEIHPNGGPAVPPVPYLDRWLADALRAAQVLSGRAVGPASPAALQVTGGSLSDPVAPRPGPRVALPTAPVAARIAGAADGGSPFGAVFAAGLTLLLLRRRRPRPTLRERT